MSSGQQNCDCLPSVLQMAGCGGSVGQMLSEVK